MSISFLEFPTHDDWQQIYQASPFGKILSNVHNLITQSRVGDGILALTKAIELRQHILEVRERLRDTGTSYILMMFYYEKGIPDQHWYGEEGEAFPDFEERHFYIKGWFDFYSDICYYKLFSAWDSIGHVLNVKYDLQVKKVDFGSAVRKLKGKDAKLYNELEGVRRSSIFQRANRIRNDITHNRLPNTVGMAVYRSDRHITIGVKEYVTSEEIVTNFRGALDLFDATIQYLLS